VAKHEGGPLRVVLAALCVGTAVAGASAAALAAHAAESPFAVESRSAMSTMMAGMDVRSTGRTDDDFVAMMVPHHQGAIDMAKSELRYGHDEQLRRIAQEIIVEQQQEIIAMRLALGQRLPPSMPAPDQASGVHRSPAAMRGGS